MRSSDAYSPYRNIYGRCFDKSYFAEETCSRIPSCRERPVLKKHDNAVFALVNRLGSVATECVVAIRPFSDLFSVYENLSLAHRSVEKQFEMSVLRIIYIDGSPVTSFAHIWQTAGTSGLFGRHGFAVLGYGNCLQVIGLVERTVDGPVVRNADLLPA